MLSLLTDRVAEQVDDVVMMRCTRRRREGGDEVENHGVDMIPVEDVDLSE